MKKQNSQSKKGNAPQQKPSVPPQYVPDVDKPAQEEAPASDDDLLSQEPAPVQDEEPQQEQKPGFLMKILLLFKPVKDLLAAKEELQGNVAGLEADLDQSKNSVAALIEEKQDLQKKLDNANGAIEDKVKEIGRLNSEKEASEGLFNQQGLKIAELDKQVGDLKAKLEDKAKEIENANAESLRSDESTKGRISALTTDKEKLKAENSELEAKLSVAVADKKQLEAANSQLQDTVNNLNLKLANADAAQMALQSELEELKEINPDVVSIVELKQQLANADAAKEQAVQAAKDAVQAEAAKQLQAAKDEAAKQLQAAKDEAAKQLQAAKDEVAKQLQAVKDEAKANKLAMQEQHKQELADVKAAHLAAMDAQKAEHAKEMSEAEGLYKGMMDEMAKNHEEVVASIISKHEAEVEDLNAKHKAETETLVSDRDAAVIRADALFESYAELLKNMLKDTQAELSKAYPAGMNDTIGMLIEAILTKNDMIDFADFSERLFYPAFDKVAEKSAQELDGNLKEAYKKLLKPMRPTWLDALMRLDAMVSVDFIAQQYAANGLDISAVHRAAGNVRRLLAAQGIRLDVPRLFVDKFDSDKHEAQPIKDIAQQVEDVASHVPNAETIIDIFTLGYHSDDNELSRRPAVSRLNA